MKVEQAKAVAEERAICEREHKYDQGSEQQ